VSIAGIYRTTDTALPPEVLARPAMVRLEGEKIRIEPLGA
jgi:septum site-determining protein MinC